MPLLLALVPPMEGNLQRVPGQVLPNNQQIKLLNQEGQLPLSAAAIPVV